MAVHLAKGVRDHLPEAMHHRLHVMATLRAVFERFGFEPVETPAIERIETLSGKYGDEGEKLMYRILKRGEGGQRGEVDLALRYDLTVPLARLVAMHPELRLPFKRWQIAPVWRADRPQKGRFREFVQCDVDICGTTSPLADAECLAVASAGLTALGFDAPRIRLNDRRILRGMARAAGADAEQEIPVLIAVDKLDKIGRDGVSAELERLGLSADGLARLWAILDVPAGGLDTLDALAPLLDDEGRAGVEALREVVPLAHALGVPEADLVVDPTLARGLDYYTGPVYEVALDADVGSVAGGGRYDGLVGMFSGRDVPAVGVSFGIERLIAVLADRGDVPTGGTAAQVLVTRPNPDRLAYAVEVVRTLREAGVNAELYLDDRKLKAQLKYANARGFPWVAFAGPDEKSERTVTLKNFESGLQETVSLSSAARRIQMG